MLGSTKARARPGWRTAPPLLLLLLFLGCTACSVRKLAIAKLGDALAESGATFTSDDDPELVEAALPFGLKLMESLLAESPEHRGLLVAASGGFTRYAYAFVQTKADEIEERDLATATTLRDRARRLYLRARDYGVRGLETRHDDLGSALRRDPRRAVGEADLRDVPSLYWTAVSWAGAIALAKHDPQAVSDLPIVEALIERALELDEAYDDGAIHVFMIAYETSRPAGADVAATRAREHFRRAMELSGGASASPLVALAESVALAEQNRAEFVDLLQRALAIDAAARPERRLENLIAQRRARWLLERTDRLILG